MHYKIVVLLSLFSILNLNLLGQKEVFLLNIKPDESLLKLNSIPFANVQIIDNRIDSGSVYKFQNFLYPITSYNIPLGEDFFKIYFKDLLNLYKEKNTNKNLLLVINELRVSNKKNMLRRFPPAYNIVNYKQRNFIMFSGSSFIEDKNGKFKKIATVKGMTYLYNDFYGLKKSVSQLLTMFFISSCDINHFNDSSISNNFKKYKFLNNVDIYNYSRDTTTYNKEWIKSNTLNRWLDLPIQNIDSYSLGIYKCFDDFRNNRIVSANFTMLFNEKSGAYRPVNFDGDLKLEDTCFAIAFKGELFFHLLRDTYIKMNKVGDKFSFIIPESLPNIYTLLSIEENHKSFNFKIHALSDMQLEEIEKIISRFNNKFKVITNNNSGSYRMCTLDLDDGDIIY